MNYIRTDASGVLLHYGEAGTRDSARQQVAAGERLFEIDQNAGMLQCEELQVVDGELVPAPGFSSPIVGEGTTAEEIPL